MSEQEKEVTEATSVTEAVKPVIKPTTPKAAPAKVTPKTDVAGDDPADRVPANWAIHREGETIHARNAVTRRTYSGDAEGFNRLMKGE